MSDLIERLGGTVAVATMTGVAPPSVTAWRKRGIPAERCPAIEHATQGAVTVEALRPDAAWSRIPDPAWPHPAGRPVIDVARPVAVAHEGA
jgi:DNA-binding transcriptional regulator YdaS (Cro superfamily)